MPRSLVTKRYKRAARRRRQTLASARLTLRAAAQGTTNETTAALGEHQTPTHACLRILGEPAREQVGQPFAADGSKAPEPTPLIRLRQAAKDTELPATALPEILDDRLLSEPVKGCLTRDAEDLIR